MKKVLLIVDDEIQVLHSLERVFEDDDYQVLSANSGAEGLKLIKEYSPQVIISDQRMPNMTGAEFLIQAKKIHPNSIRMILSGFSDFDAIKEAINQGGIYKFFNKPWDNDVLREEVREAFSINAQQKENELQLIRLMNHAKTLNLNQKAQNGNIITENELVLALEQDQFVLMYQPIVSVKTQQIFGCETLIRWQHPTRGLLSPDYFIPLSEQIGFIIPLSLSIIRKSCEELSRWQKLGFASLFMGINLPANIFSDAKLLDTVKDILNTNNIAPECLDFEITESILMQNIKSNIITLENLKKLGVKIAIDDFGTGYSSLSYLKDFPIDILKIDKSFIDHITEDTISSEIVNTIIQLGKSLNLLIIAEGVQTQQQFELLKMKQCDFIQGGGF